MAKTPTLDSIQEELDKLKKYHGEDEQEPTFPYVIVRTYSAGVFAGYIKKREGREVTLIKARRLYYWEGAATLSELAMSGTSKPTSCKFPEEVDEVLLLEAIEIINVTSKAKNSIKEVKVWSAH